MVSRLQYDEKFDKAMRYIFGKTLICRKLENATGISKRYGLDCITVEGDQVSIAKYCMVHNSYRAMENCGLEKHINPVVSVCKKKKKIQMVRSILCSKLVSGLSMFPVKATYFLEI